MLSWKRRVLALLLFGTAFGYLEAAVVSYLRYLHEPIRQRFYPGRDPGELFPLLTRDQAEAGGPEVRKVLLTEVGREAATIVMLASVASGVAAGPGQWAAAFVIAFGAWDITFYLFLKLLLGWPASVFTWDILFIIPVPWVGPVAAPVLVSVAMIAAGIWHIYCESAGRNVHLSGWNWAAIVIGAAIIIVSFTLDSANVAGGGLPQPFHWTIFGSGLSIGIFGYLSAAASRNPQAVTLSRAAG
ncbi:MAG: hypothetical protein C5B51_32505 [Terriglobia bacterium]|nr:MAG: hypothetical protein C5B51_32505 [Terriglobia bacterium]